jgi:hypothetical protein
VTDTEFKEIKKRYLLLFKVNNPQAWKNMLHEERLLIEKYNPMDVQGMLIKKVEELQAQIKDITEPFD